MSSVVADRGSTSSHQTIQGSFGSSHYNFQPCLGGSSISYGDHVAGLDVFNTVPVGLDGNSSYPHMVPLGTTPPVHYPLRLVFPPFSF